MIRGSTDDVAPTPSAEVPDSTRQAKIDALERRLAAGDDPPRRSTPREAPPGDPTELGDPGALGDPEALDPATADPDALALELDALERELDRGAGQGSAPHLRLEELVEALGRRDHRLRGEVLAVRQREREELAAIEAQIAEILRQERDEDELAIERLIDRGSLPFEARARVAKARAARPRPTMEPEEREVEARADAAEAPLQAERRRVQRLRNRARRLLRRV